jgi:alpha-beta hydrolase superfamily lysophospholipase
MTTSADVKLLQAVDHVRICYRRWQPEGECRGTVQIVHGASEHSARYGRLAQALVERGLAVYAMDLRGHGFTSLADLLRDRGLPVEQRLYPDARHEVFNETNRDEVTDDLTTWIDQRLG